jgi:glucosamine-6-phosphate deaminase
MKVIIGKNKKESVKRASQIICEIVSKKPNAVIGFATGGTMIPFYKELVKLYKKGKVDFSKVKAFNIDEFAELKNSDVNSYHYYMNKYFFSKVNVKRSNIHFPSASGKEYDKEIKKVGGLDICMLGIGENGHIGFNEPGSSFNSQTRIITLTENTRQVDSRFFKDKSRVPHHAYSIGIKTILSAKKIILLSFGDKKADAIYKSLKGKISEKVPASALRKHKDATFIIDKKSAKKL